MNNKLYLGIDGGGTKTNAILATIDDNNEIEVIGNYKSGPSNFQLTEQFYSSMDDIFEKLLEYINSRYENSLEISICAGYAGVVGVKDSVEMIKKYFQKKIKEFANLELKKIKIISDADLVLETYFKKNNPGIILISGTGSICLGKDKNGKIFRTGGFGHLIDDVGSGYYFGKSAIKLALNSFYNHNDKSPLEESVKKHYDLKNIDEVNEIVYSDIGKASVSSASPLLFKAADSGCSFAKKEIQLGINGLSNYIVNCHKLIDEKNCTVILHGTIFKAQSIVFNELVKKHKNLFFKIADRVPEITAIEMLAERK